MVMMIRVDNVLESIMVCGCFIVINVVIIKVLFLICKKDDRNYVLILFDNLLFLYYLKRKLF